jgi:hypothetical protein
VYLKNPIIVFMLKTEESSPSRMKSMPFEWREPRHTSPTKKPPDMNTEEADPKRV